MWHAHVVQLWLLAQARLSSREALLMNKQLFRVWVVLMWKVLDTALIWYLTEREACQNVPRTFELDDQSRLQLAREPALRVIEEATLLAKHRWIRLDSCKTLSCTP